eukprot:256355-Chlamydomonas_euryale.AAC.5
MQPRAPIYTHCYCSCGTGLSGRNSFQPSTRKSPTHPQNPNTDNRLMHTAPLQPLHAARRTMALVLYCSHMRNSGKCRPNAELFMLSVSVSDTLPSWLDSARYCSRHHAHGKCRMSAPSRLGGSRRSALWKKPLDSMRARSQRQRKCTSRGDSCSSSGCALMS